MDPPRRLQVNLTSGTTDQSRIRIFITVQEMLLEYSLVIIMLGCFLLLSLPSKIVPKFGALEDRVYWL